MDVLPGKNVDVVMKDAYVFPQPDNSVDIIVCGQAFEHIEFFWLTMLEMKRILKPEGYLFLIAPSTGPIHRYPVDCWRFYPDGFKALAGWSGLKLLQIKIAQERWGDTGGVFTK